MQSSQSREISTSIAAEKLDVTQQTVRDWVRSGKLKGRQTDTGRWRIVAVSMDALLANDRQVEDAPTAASQTLEDRLAEITTLLAGLQRRELASERLLRAVERERDGFRAEAVALREASLQLTAAARETDAGVRRLLEVLEHQRAALAQLLTPGTPQDLMP